MDWVVDKSFIMPYPSGGVVQILNQEGAQANMQTTRKIVALLYEQLK